jgi:hypothetical protein
MLAGGGVDTSAPAECDRNEVFCIDVNGSALSNERDPDLEPGGPLTIIVIGDSSSAPTGELTLKADAPIGLSTDRCFETADAGGKGTGHEGDAGGEALDPFMTVGLTADDASAPREQLDAGKPSNNHLLSLHIDQVPSAAFTVHYTATTTCEKDASTRVDRPLTFSVGQSGYHLDPSFMFPLVFGGQRQVNLVPLPNTQDHTIEASQSLLPTPITLALQVFPMGIPGGHFATIVNHAALQCSGSFWDATTRRCSPWWTVYNLLRPLGLLVGTDIAPNQLDQYYLGGTYQPVRGFSFSAGAAFVKGEFIPPNYAAGMLAPTNGTTFTPDTRYMMRPYIGVAISPELLGLLVNLLTSVQKVGAPAAGTP